MIIRWYACSWRCAAEYMKEIGVEAEWDITIRPADNRNITHSKACLERNKTEPRKSKTSGTGISILNAALSDPSSFI